MNYLSQSWLIDRRHALQAEAKKNEYRIKDIVRAVAMSELMRKR